MDRQSGMSRRDLLGASIALPLTALATPVATAAPACGVTPAQTTGPFYPIYDQVDKDVDLTRLTGHGASAAGDVIRVQGGSEEHGNERSEDHRRIPRRAPPHSSGRRERDGDGLYNSDLPRR